MVLHVAGWTAAASVAIALGMAGWRTCGRYGDDCERAGQFFPAYNVDTGEIDLVMRDLNGNGVIDTWVYRTGSGIEEVEIDRDEDGVADRLLVAGANGTFHFADASPAP